MQKSIYIFLFFLAYASFLNAQENKMVPILEGSFVPLYGATSKKPVLVKSFFIDVFPVTNNEYLNFLKKHPEFSRSKIKELFADKSYLTYWKNDFDFGNANPKAPITSISWFAAKRYCECLGKRLPTMDEWEYVAMADEKKTDARTKREFNNYILSWY
ncbi:Serine/threonine-protein kinase pkn1 [compost metagenome]